jgi:hypothetical protein
MANTVRIKRRSSGNPGAPASLQNAELAFNEVDSTLYYGVGTGGTGGSATSVLAIGGPGSMVTLTGAQTISGNKTFTGTVDLSGATISTISTTGNITVGGNLTVSGTTTTVNSTTVTVADINIELGKIASPTDTTANGGGLTLHGATDKTFNWVSSTAAWTSSEHLNLASGKAFYINGTSVLNGTTLGSGITGSSLTSVGALTGGTWNANTIGVAYGGTGATTLTGLVKGNGTSAFTAAVDGTDYLSPNATIDGGTF